MTEEGLGRRLAQILEGEADAVEVRGTWDDIANRLLEPDGTGQTRRSIGSTRSRRVLGLLAAGLGAAAVIVLAVWLGWRPPTLTPAAPVGPSLTGVPRYDPAIPTLVVHRPSGGEPMTKSRPNSTRSELTLTPERMRTDTPDVGRVALEAMAEVPPLQPLDTDWGERLQAQEIDVGSVRISDGLIQVDLDRYFAPPFQGAEAHLLAQAWVRTLQDTLSVRDPVLIRLQNRPFRLYGSIDTTKPLTRDESVPILRPDGFDSPRPDDVVPGHFVLLGSATPGPDGPARVQVVDLGTGAIAYEWDVAVPADERTAVDFAPVLSLDPGQYRATLTSRGLPGIRDIRFTVVDG